MVLAPDVKDQQRHPTLVCAQHTSTFPGASTSSGPGRQTIAKSKIIASQEALPRLVRLHLVNKHRAAHRRDRRDRLAHHHRSSAGAPSAARCRKLPDRCSHSPAVPCHFAWKADIQRKQSGHLVRPPRRGNRSRLINEHESNPISLSGWKVWPSPFCLIDPRQANAASSRRWPARSRRANLPGRNAAPRPSPRSALVTCG